MLTKKYSHNLKVEGYFIWWECLGPWAPSDSISRALRKLLQGGRSKSGYIQVCNKGSRQSEHGRSGTKLRNLAFYVRADVSPWAHRIPSFICTSAVWGQSCFLIHLASCIPPAPQQSLWGVAGSAGLQFWGPSFTFGGQKSLVAVTFLVD